MCVCLCMSNCDFRRWRMIVLFDEEVHLLSPRALQKSQQGLYEFTNLQIVSCKFLFKNSIQSPVLSSFSKLQVLLRIEEENGKDGKELNFLIMQEGDPRFVYKLILRKTDFNRIKKDQELDTDFDAFPGEIIDFMQSSDSNICVKGFFNSDKSKFRQQLTLWLETTSLVLMTLHLTFCEIVLI
ncbi:unnamed protein product [Dracunculus medinensis]|uniref:SAS-6_N domain-containing protein n=1 Tax=Dracunculus medinensis TaxID=318479 RepID=A0A0N4U5V3_DRAME|nr:unnamed protein product [Dracunculus medinensis]